MTARAIMVQGTASGVGKSLVATALCRIFRQRGLRVAPFKAQNMALNSAVTPDGLEIGRAQAVQAQAAGVTATVDMNPILLKPEGAQRSQLVLMGRPAGQIMVASYAEQKARLREQVCASLQRLRAQFELLVIEGAGSPVEMNLKAGELVNMFVAKAADARVLLVGDIDRGGVFASLVGTMELFEADERERVGAFLINKFRGERAHFADGVGFLEQRLKIPALGVLPHIPALRIADEDSVALEDKSNPRTSRSQISIAVIRLSWISNFDDFDPLAHEPAVALCFEDSPEAVACADLVILPGSKSTVADLFWLQERGLAQALEQRHAEGRPILGICGGCQMLGERIADPHGVESSHQSVPGLNLLPLRTTFERTKVTAQVRARWVGESLLWGARGLVVSGYEIHMGRVSIEPSASPAFTIMQRNGVVAASADGAISADGAVVGTMLHGLFENESMRRELIERLWRRRGAQGAPEFSSWSREAEYDRLAEIVRANIDERVLDKLVGL